MLNTEQGTISTINERKAGNRTYRLCSVSLGGLKKYILYMRDGAEEELSLVDTDKDSAEALFDAVVSNELSCEHLADVAADHSREYQIKRVNI
ncbi:MAG: hypothetical protein J6B72_03600 [Clostridia bacterium]|nr:hypothetical protein [Clostridia bacterium]